MSKFIDQALIEVCWAMAATGLLPGGGKNIGNDKPPGEMAGAAAISAFKRRATSTP